MRKKLVSLLLVVALTLCIGSVANADTAVDAPPNQIAASPVQSKSDAFSQSVETDPEELQRIIEQDNIEVPEGYHLVSVTTTIVNSPSPKEIIVTPRQGYTYYLSNVQTVGERYYADDYDSDWFDGPASVSETYTQTRSAGWSATGGVSSGVVSVGVGFSVTSTVTKTRVFTTTVAANERLNVRIHTNYKVKSYDVYRRLNGGTGELRGSGSAWQPIGLIFKQYRYAQ